MKPSFLHYEKTIITIIKQKFKLNNGDNSDSTKAERESSFTALPMELLAALEENSTNKGMMLFTDCRGNDLIEKA